MLLHGEDVLVKAHLNFGKFILDILRRTEAHRTCLQSSTTGYKLSYKEFAQYSVSLATALTGLGFRRGETVAVAGEPGSTYFPAGLAVMLTGATLTLLETQCGRAILNHKLNLTKPKYVICTRLFWEEYNDILKKSESIQTFISFDDIEGIELSVDAMVASQGHVDVDTFEPAAVNGQTDVVLTTFSSGTTGMSKGVLLTHLNCIARVSTIAQWYHDFESLDNLKIGFTPEPDRTSIYDFKMICALICAGKTVIYSESEVDLKMVQALQVEVMPTTPVIVEMMLNEKDEYDLSSLKLVITAGSALNPQTAKRLQERYPDIKLICLYGTSESGVIATTQNKSFSFEVANEGAEGTCVGHVAPDATIKIVDVNTKEVLGPNQRGELHVRGPRVMKGYLGATGPYLDEEGFYPTGDHGYFDENKHVYLVGRIKDVICYMGQKVSPGEIEAVLQQHPAVQEAAVVGKPADVEGQELPAAFVVLRPGAVVTEEDIVVFVAKQVTWYMQLRGGVRFLAELPRNSRRKILRRELKEMLTRDQA